MTLDRPTKTFIAVFTLVAALLLGVNHAIEQSPLEDWWLPALLLLISVAFWIWLWQEKLDDESTSITVVNGTTPEPLGAQEWIISKEEPAVQKSVSNAEEALRREMDKTVATITQTTEVPASEEEDPVAEASTTEPEPVTADVPPTDPVTVAEVEEAAPAAPVVEDVPATDPVTVEAEEETVATESTAADVVAEEPATEPEPTPEPEVTPAPTASADDDEVDDLERIEGIGPKYADALIAAGISTFADVASASLEKIQQAAKDAGMRRSASMSTWAEQAVLAAKGDWDGLNDLQEKLTGGRR